MNWMATVQVIKLWRRSEESSGSFCGDLVGIHAYAWLRYRLDWCRLNKLDSNVNCVNIFHFHNIGPSKISLRQLISQLKDMEDDGQRFLRSLMRWTIIFLGSSAKM